MAQTAARGVEALRATIAGTVLVPTDGEYDDARRVWNASIDRHPAVIARCRSTQDVVTAVACAREQGLEISVRGGAHNNAGTALCDGGLMIDLSELRDVTVDPEARRVRVGGGALLADTTQKTSSTSTPISNPPESRWVSANIRGVTVG